MSPQIAGLDLSLTSTGLARIEGNLIQTGLLKPKSTGHQRMEFLRSQIAMHCLKADLIVIEGPSYGSPAGSQRGHHERAGLWWIVTQMLWEAQRPVAIVSPAELKRFATGKGNASKDEVLIAVVRRMPTPATFNGNDMADALVLAAMGADHLGYPIAAMPQTHRAALAKVSWPAQWKEEAS